MVRDIESFQKKRKDMLTEARLLEKGPRQDDLAKNIVYTDQEINAKNAQLAQVHRQRDMVWQLVAFGERADLLRRFPGIDAFGRQLNMEKFKNAVENSVAGGQLDMGNLTTASTMLKDALSFTSANVEDEGLLQVLAEIEQSSKAPITAMILDAPPPLSAPQMDRVMRGIQDEIERQ